MLIEFGGDNKIEKVDIAPSNGKKKQWALWLT